MGTRAPLKPSMLPQSKGPNWVALVVSVIAVLVLIALYSSSCAPPPPPLPGDSGARPTYGETRVQEIISYKGQPTTETVIATSAPSAAASVGAAASQASAASARVLEYADGENIQVEGDVVVARFRRPQGKESKIQFWRLRFSGDPDRLETAVLPKRGHGPDERQLSSPKFGETIVFDGKNGRVLRVVEHEKAK